MYHLYVTGPAKQGISAHKFCVTFLTLIKCYFILTDAILMKLLGLKKLFIIHGYQEMYIFLKTCNMCRYARFLQAQSNNYGVIDCFIRDHQSIYKIYKSKLASELQFSMHVRNTRSGSDILVCPGQII